MSVLIASGASYRIDPVLPLRVQDLPPSSDPERPFPVEDWHPTVAVVDGGLNAKSYKNMQAWEAPSLVSDVAANFPHGNRVTSLVVHGHAWNKHLKLPDLVCRVGTVQAIAKDGQDEHSREKFLSYLREVVEAHASECKVWNMSFNERTLPGDEVVVSEIGHGIRAIAREFSILPVVSIGNVDSHGHGLVCPPGDCEASLTVGGRVSVDGFPDGHCSACVTGPGPDGMLKPDLSWFSTMRVIGGSIVSGSSFAAPLVATLAAHAFHALKNPTPDLVRALLINAADQDVFDRRIGWGTPATEQMPWVCADESVTLVWTATLSKGQAYYWNDIPIPPEMLHDGKLIGRACLTAVLAPLVSELASANYFSSRVEVALQTESKPGIFKNLLGTMKESVTKELDARSELAKWHPVRRHSRDFKKGVKLSSSTMRVYARVFVRDPYQFEDEELEQPQNVAFVLTLRAPTGDVYSSMTVRLGQYVESAVVAQEVSVDA
ncbi:S8 family peptidase [Luteibacter sp. 9133]|uniref:S8 family peptidase n=1 Tax=Luteibacter sp. 9133 TaxID=1500891 RepID=UPI0018CF4D3C|nr:S8 family peptidase [Luteibacter sp. 9133]